MIAADVPLCGHIHLTCINDHTVTNYCCRNFALIGEYVRPVNG
jgi:hypothetical protein